MPYPGRPKQSPCQTHTHSLNCRHRKSTMPELPVRAACTRSNRPLPDALHADQGSHTTTYAGSHVPQRQAPNKPCMDKPHKQTHSLGQNSNPPRTPTPGAHSQLWLRPGCSSHNTLTTWATRSREPLSGRRGCTSAAHRLCSKSLERQTVSTNTAGSHRVTAGQRRASPGAEQAWASNAGRPVHHKHTHL